MKTDADGSFVETRAGGYAAVLLYGTAWKREAGRAIAAEQVFTLAGPFVIRGWYLSGPDGEVPAWGEFPEAYRAAPCG